MRFSYSVLFIMSYSLGNDLKIHSNGLKPEESLQRRIAFFFDYFPLFIGNKYSKSYFKV